MNKLLMVAAGALLFGVMAGAGAAGAADETATEIRVIDARITRVRLDGIVDLNVRQGAVPSLVISGNARLVGQTTSRQAGDTLIIENDDHGMRSNGRRTLRAELVLPALRELVSESLGRSDVSGFSGENINLSLDGAGSMTMHDSRYRVVKVSLGGLGSMNMHGLNAELIELNLEGAGYVTLEGRAKTLRANMEGLGGLDAKQFMVESVTVDLSGLGSATVNAHLNANLNLSGLGSVTVYGKPLNRKVSVDGLGKVSWK
ncbi:GIN domain-containing protein [Massilia sp. S19_KUP03_FR1]|uniref:GIN domain-containing protein n=1 Tax=Massilia sp. S19_KUP03_FR1 TaxID=3025503 RepID=UPI002FCD9171